MNRRRIVSWCAAALFMLGACGGEGRTPASKGEQDGGPDAGGGAARSDDSAGGAGAGSGGSAGDAGMDDGGPGSDPDAGLGERDSGTDAGGDPEVPSAPPFEGTANFSFAPGNAALRSASYRMQVQVGLSLGPQAINSANVRMQGASAVVIREARP